MLAFLISEDAEPRTRLIIILATFAILCIGSCGLLWYADYLERSRSEVFQSQRLSDETIDDLCSRKLVPPDVGDCSDPNLTIEYRYVRTIVEANIEENTSTYDDVQLLFGEYRRACFRDEPGRAGEYFCRYQIERYPFSAVFQKDTDLLLNLGWPSPGS